MKVRYKDCTKEQQALIDRYFVKEEIDALLTAVQKRIAEGWDLARWAKEYGTDVQEWSEDVSFVDVSAGKHMYSVFGRNDGSEQWMGARIDFWDDWSRTYLLEYDWVEDVFFLG